MKTPILSYEEHDSRSNKLPTPYVYFLGSDKGSLTYFGASHSNNPSNTQYPILQQKWAEFIKTTSEQSRLAMVEGGMRRATYKDDIQAITVDGEAGLLTLLANNSGVKIVSPDPSDEQILTLIEKNFGLDEYYFYELAHHIQSLYRISSTKRVDYSAYHSICISNEKIKSLLIRFEAPGTQPQDRAWWDSVTNPVQTEHRMNAVARAASVYRDEMIVSQIVKAINQGKNIFAVYGRSHVLMQEPYLRNILGCDL